MKHKIFLSGWGVLFVLCAGLGFLPAPTGWTTALSVLFFLPPAVLLYRGGDDIRLLIRNLSALSLGVTLVILILNVVLAAGSETLGNVLHYVLAVVSTPMIASGNWAMSLFLWACLLMASLKKR